MTANTSVWPISRAIPVTVRRTPTRRSGGSTSRSAAMMPPVAIVSAESG